MLSFDFSNSIVEFLLDPRGTLLNFFEPYYPFFPSLALLLAAMLILVLPKDALFSYVTALAATMIAIVMAIWTRGMNDQPFFHQMVTWNMRAHVAQEFILFSLLASLLVAQPLLKKAGTFTSEYAILMLLAAVGGIYMAASSHLISLFLAIELMSLSLYALCAFRKHQARSREAGFKYFMVGAVASALFMMGSAYLYGASGSFLLLHIDRPPIGSFYLLGSCFLLAAVAFKSAVFPFHQWLPDVYEGAPSAVTGFMSSAVKMAIFSLLLTLMIDARLFYSVQWVSTLKILIIISMTVANLAAIRQKSVKRMLAYSSIAHVAYTFIALLSFPQLDGTLLAGRVTAAVLFYVVVYGVASLGAFAVLGALDPEEDKPFDDELLRGLSKRQPLLALALASFLLSLAGIPPLAGFVGKLNLLSSAVAAGHYDLVIATIINSLIGVYYYARPVVRMYMDESNAPQGRWFDRKIGVSVLVVIIICWLLSLYFGCFPAALYTITGQP